MRNIFQYLIFFLISISLSTLSYSFERGGGVRGGHGESMRQGQGSWQGQRQQMNPGNYQGNINREGNRNWRNNNNWQDNPHREVNRNWNNNNWREHNRNWNNKNNWNTNDVNAIIWGIGASLLYPAYYATPNYYENTYTTTNYTYCSWIEAHYDDYGDWIPAHQECW